MSDNDNSMYLGPVVAAEKVLDVSLRLVILGDGGRPQPLQSYLPESNVPGTSGTMDTISGYLVRMSLLLSHNSLPCGTEYYFWRLQALANIQEK